MRIKTQILTSQNFKITLPPCPLLSVLNSVPSFLYLFPSSVAEEWVMEVMVSSSHIVSVTASSSRCDSFTCSIMGYIPLETVLCVLPQHEPFPLTAVLHKLLQLCFHGLQSIRCPTESQVSARTLLQHSFPVGSQLTSRHPAAPAWVSSMGCSCLPMSAPGAAGKSQLQHLEHFLLFLLH